MIEWIERTRETLTPWLAKALQSLTEVVLILFLGVVAHFLIVRLFRRIRRYHEEKGGWFNATESEGQKRISTLFGLLRNVLLALLWSVTALMVIGKAGVDVTPLLAGAGIAGLAIGFGAQSIVRDLFSGIFHILENQVRVGDVVRINGVGGLVEAVTYRIIVLRDLHYDVHVFPHGKVETLTNMTKTHSGAVLDIGVAYREDPDRVIEALRVTGEELANAPDWAERILEPMEVLGVEALADSAVVYRVRFKTLPIEQWKVAREYRRRVKIAFDREGIEIPFPHRTVYFASDSAPLAVSRDAADGGSGENARDRRPGEANPMPTEPT